MKRQRVDTGASVLQSCDLAALVRPGARLRALPPPPAPYTASSSSSAASCGSREAAATASRDLRLIEVPKDLVKEIEEAAASRVLWLKGALAVAGAAAGMDSNSGGGGGAVLCSASRTFTVKRVETSNTVCLAPPSSPFSSAASPTIDIVATKHEYYEISVTAPRLGGLKELLCPGGNKTARGVDGARFRAVARSEVDARVQASPREVSEALRQLGAEEVDVIKTAAAALLASATELGWSLGSVAWDDAEAAVRGAAAAAQGTDDADASAAARDDIRPFIVGRALQLLGGAPVSAAAPRGPWRLDSVAVARCAAEVLLAADPGKKWELHDFLQEWELRVPGASSGPPPLDALKGIAVIELDPKTRHNVSSTTSTSTGRGCVMYLPKDGLPDGIDARLASLFASRSRWTAEELRPYLEDLLLGDDGGGAPLVAAAAKAKTVEELLLGRAKRVDGVIFVANA